LVRLQNVPRGGQQQRGERKNRHRVFPFQPGQEYPRGHKRHYHQGRAQVRLQENEQRGEAGKDSDLHQVRQRQPLRPQFAQVTSQRHYYNQLRQFRHLQVQKSQVQPPPRPELGLSQHQH